MRTNDWRSLVLATLVSCVLTGCSDRPKAYPAAGVVVYTNGAPVQDARIEVRSTEQPFTARGSIDRQGRFQLTTFQTNDGAIAGRHEVLIIQRFTAEIDDIARHSQHASRMRQVDHKYASYQTSGLEFTIDPTGDNTNLRLVVEARGE